MSSSIQLRPNEAPMPDALAYFLTWTTYGTWLPGDERGWVLKGEGFQQPNLVRKTLSSERMVEKHCLLDGKEREIVEQTIREHCRIRGWDLHAVNCRTNHVHVVVTANTDSKTVRDQLKAWCTRRLKENSNEIPVRSNWWTERGSRRSIGDSESLIATVVYVLEGQ